MATGPWTVAIAFALIGMVVQVATLALPKNSRLYPQGNEDQA